MAIRKKVTAVMKAIRLVVTGSGILILSGCILPTVRQVEPDGPAIIQTPLASAIPTRIQGTGTAPVTPPDRNPTPTVTQTSLPSPAPIQSSAEFEESFVDNRNNWQTDSTLFAVTAGTYSHKIDCPESNPSPHCGRFIKIPFIFPRNFRMEMDATLINSSAGAGVMVAFEVRRKAEYYYINYSLTDSQFQLSRISQYGIFPIIPQTPTDLIKTAPGEPNRLGIEVKDTVLTPLVNGQALAPAHDGKLPNAGESYLVLLVARGHTAELQFDNLVVQEVK